MFGLNQVAFVGTEGAEISFSNLKLSLRNAKLIEGNLSSVFNREHGDCSILKMGEEDTAGIKVSFSSETTLAEVKVKNYRGQHSSSYGIKCLTILVNSISVFSGELTVCDSDGETNFNLSLFVNQHEGQTSNMKKGSAVYLKKDMNKTNVVHSQLPDFPTLVKHKSQDISVTSQQSDGSTSRVIISLRDKKAPKGGKFDKQSFQVCGRQKERSKQIISKS